jgi:hypothetical protein
MAHLSSGGLAPSTGFDLRGLRAADLDPGLLPALLALVEPQERGDPVSPLRWTTMSTRSLAAELTR